MLKTKLSYHDWSNRVQSMTKTKQDNTETDHIDLVYVEYDTELSRAIWLVAVYAEN